jgi:hypothetical protein
VFDNGGSFTIDFIQMRRIVLSMFIALQAIYFVSAVCGGNLSASKSMACCQDGQMDRSQMHDPNTRSCCSHCDMGKNKSVVKLQKAIQKELNVVQVSVGIIGKIDSRSILGSKSYENKRWYHQTFTASSPPSFILNEELLI